MAVWDISTYKVYKLLLFMSKAVEHGATIVYWGCYHGIAKKTFNVSSTNLISYLETLNMVARKGSDRHIICCEKVAGIKQKIQASNFF